MTSPSPLDEISFKLGEISAGMAMLNTKVAKQDQQLTGLATNVGEIKTRMKPLTDDINKMKPQVDHYRRVRGAIGVVGTAILAVGGVVGGAVGDYLLKRFT